jgi:hypothetical protein
VSREIQMRIETEPKLLTRFKLGFYFYERFGSGFALFCIDFPLRDLDPPLPPPPLPDPTRVAMKLNLHLYYLDAYFSLDRKNISLKISQGILKICCGGKEWDLHRNQCGSEQFTPNNEFLTPNQAH